MLHRLRAVWLGLAREQSMTREPDMQEAIWALKRLLAQKQLYARPCTEMKRRSVGSHREAREREKRDNARRRVEATFYGCEVRQISLCSPLFGSRFFVPKMVNHQKYECH